MPVLPFLSGRDHRQFAKANPISSHHFPHSRHGSAPRIYSVSVSSAPLFHGVMEAARSLSDYQFRKFKVVITDSNARWSSSSSGHQMAFQEHKRASRPYVVREIGVLRQAPRQGVFGLHMPTGAGR
jgi:hypothetical protein